MPIQHVTEVSAFDEEIIHKIAKDLAGSERKFKIFEAVYTGGNKPKDATRLAALTGLDEIAVLQLATPMAHQQYFERVKEKGGRVSFKKLHHINAKKDKIMRLAKNPVSLKKHVTIRNPRGTTTVLVRMESRKRTEVKVREIFIDDVEEFRDVLDLKAAKLPALTPQRLPEKIFKYGVAKILGDKGKFTDWGGEKNDLYSSNVTIGGQRISTAFAFKGPGTAPPLTIAKLGKNGDQIPRLFLTTAEAFFVQFEGTIDEAVKNEMLTYAFRKSKETGKEIFYGLIALEDSHRLRVRYEDQFAPENVPATEEAVAAPGAVDAPIPAVPSPDAPGPTTEPQVSE